ncbi:ATP-binding protein [Alysiella crassa]|uniref:Chemotaxis protein CheA n=1 Tax=Alysiella crassa TaxID=153491 RepID=A0A376BTX7_9NEIS|nr:ATP-binding protein [Alysiella crassa]UOP05990.1 ATP-binding protein [Alysiella crassa]SSY80437.1 Chemotaxis protein CheA [Alysiella crassa]
MTTNTPNSIQTNIVKKYSSLLILVGSFFTLILVLALLTYFTTKRFEQVANTQKVLLQQSVITQELTQNLLNINLYGTNQLAANTAVQAASAATIPANNQTAIPTTAASQVNTQPENIATQIPFDTLPQTALYRIADIEKARVIFNDTLKALKEGGRVNMLDGSVVELERADDVEILNHLNHIEQIWIPYEGLLANFSNGIQNKILDKNISDYLVDYTRLYNKPLQAELNSITNNLNITTSNNAAILRTIQILGVILAVIIFTLIVFRVLKRLVRTDTQLDFAKRQTDDIMNTVNEGLFLINKDLVIAEQYSAKLEEILCQKNIAGRTLYDLLQGIINQKDMNTTKLFVDQLYNHWVVEELIQDLNPLKKVAVSYLDEYGFAHQKFVEFSFLRVLDESQTQVESVFVSVVDITKEIRLQEQMEKDRVQHDSQIEMIGYLLNTDSHQLLRFISETKERLERMNNILKQDNTINLRDKTEQLYRETHSLKGDASAVKLASLVGLAEKQEEMLKQLKSRMKLKGDDFLPFTVTLDEMINMVSFIESLLQRLNLQDSTSVRISEPSNAQSENVSYWKSYFSQYAQEIAHRQGKKVVVQVLGFDDMARSEQTMSIYKDITTQLLKNAIVHGIETPAERNSMGKPQTGVVILSLESHHNKDHLQVKDDGKGIDWDKLREKAVEAGLYSSKEVAQLSSKDLLNVMFQSGISTASAQDEDAGRGVGMDIVKQLSHDMGAKMNVSSSAKQFTQIHISFPQK